MTMRTAKPSSKPDDDAHAPPDLPERFAVRDESSANWVVRKIVEARAYQARIKDWAERETRRIEREEEFLVRRFEGELARWATTAMKAFKGKRKCVSLPAGRIGFRKVGAKLVIDDKDAVLRWAKRHLPAAVVLIERLDKIMLNKQFKGQGEVPATGAHVEPAGERFYVR
jgi:hypothetical protein